MLKKESFCCNNLTNEFKKVERRLKQIAIPVFSLITTIFLINDNPNFTNIFFDFFFHLISMTVFIIIFWMALRFAFFKVRNLFPEEKYFVRRLIILSIISLLLSIIIYIADIGLFLFLEIKEGTFWECLIKHRLMLLATITFSFLVNTIYLSFHLFHKLSEKAIEVEEFKKSMVESQYQNLADKVNPHFLFNNLNTLAGIIEESPKKAVAFVEELSDVYRYVLNSGKKTWTDLDSELIFAKAYISLLKTRFENNLEFVINLPDSCLKQAILPLTLQMLIENAVKHNEISNQKKLTVKLFCQDNFLIVENNINPKKINTESTKIGLKNINDRYFFLTEKNISVEQTSDCFKIQIPLFPYNL